MSQRTLPAGFIVANVADPVGGGLVASMARPTPSYAQPAGTKGAQDPRVTILLAEGPWGSRIGCFQLENGRRHPCANLSC